ncbi:MAG: sigma-70 family RNA polymerase sigma factor [candidate division Zixibacteria bacterium]|nr:sigma-70 family RNA polymerase sigma factor [candidate division Zixibacteria bacterium]
MTKELNIQIIHQAQAGNSQSLSAVGEQVRKKVNTYIYRLTLDYHLTQDLTQETILEMIKAFPKLKVHHVSGFWGWIFRTALGKVQHHFRLQGARRLAQKTTSDDSVLKNQVSDDNNPMNALVSEEIRKAVLGAMQAIKMKYRNILILRCFDNLSYGQIAGILGGSELRARLLFLRAKHSLKSQLERHGFKRDSLLAALTMYAGLTLGTGKKAVAGEVVLASSLETGLGVGLASLLTVKTAIAATCVLCVAGITVSMIKPGSSTRPTSEELYGHLYPLLDNEAFAAPSRVVDVNDSDKDGFQVVNLNTPQSPAQRLNPDNLEDVLLTLPHMGLVLPKGHWVELGFDGPLHDGPGPDLLITTRACRLYTRVFVTDGLNKVFELPRPQCLRMGVCWHKHILDFDLDGLDLPFEPHAVRLMGNSNRGRVGGIEFYSVLARIKRGGVLQP